MEVCVCGVGERLRIMGAKDHGRRENVFSPLVYGSAGRCVCVCVKRNRAHASTSSRCTHTTRVRCDGDEKKGFFFGWVSSFAPGGRG